MEGGPPMTMQYEPSSSVVHLNKSDNHIFAKISMGVLIPGPPPLPQTHTLTWNHPCIGSVEKPGGLGIQHIIIDQANM